MRYLIAVILSIPFISLAQEKQFNQDVATIYSNSGLPETKVLKIEVQNDKPQILVGSAWFDWNGKAWQKINENHKSDIRIKPIVPSQQKLLSYVAFGQGFAIGCDNGLFFSDQKGKQLKEMFPADSKYSWKPRMVTALTVDAKGNLWVGMQQGVAKYDGAKWKLFTGKENLPVNDFTCVASSSTGEVWFGTTRGAIRIDGDYFYYRFSRRWLPNDYVNDIVVDKTGTAWVATNNGVSRIESVATTYEKKAAYFTKQTEDRHNRMGFIAPNNLKVPFDFSSFELGISDNDGMYTAMYGAAQAFRYAATGDKEAKALADRSLKACKWLVDITHEPGFPARVIIPIDYREPVNEQYSKEYNKRHQQSDPFWKDIYPRFPLSKDGNYRWKCDTSSDELAAHYFFYGIYYDLVAKSDAEKADVRKVVADITDHLIRHGFKLVDYDGKPTRWGNFSPEYFASIWGWDQRGLNSMMMLSFLNVAKHVTGEAKYDEVAEMLRTKYNYHINAMHGKEFFPPSNVVPWDNNLALMSYYGLINYEQNPELLIMYRESLQNAWLHISKQKNAFWNAIYGGLCQKFQDKVNAGVVDPKVAFPENKLYAPFKINEYKTWDAHTNDIVETLQRIPLDLIGYEMDNTHRLDIQIDPTPGQEPTIGWRNDTYALPIDERGHVRQDRDAFLLRSREVGGGMAEHEGTFYLLPYYMSLYHHLIEK